MREILLAGFLVFRTKSLFIRKEVSRMYIPTKKEMALMAMVAVSANAVVLPIIYMIVSVMKIKGVVPPERR